MKAELKIKKFIRNHFVQNFDRQTCIFVSFFIFIHNFKFYRNNYRTLMKIYVIVAVLTFKKNLVELMCFYFIFGFHDNNFADVITALKSLIFLNENTKCLINEQKIFMCVFILTYIENMSQQEKISEFKS